MATAKRRRRSFGAVRRLPSGRWQARYRGPDGIERTAPVTFTTRTDADTWLATTQADIARDHWRAPERGDQLLADYFAAWLDARVDLAPRTVQLYASIGRRWLLSPVGRRTNLGAMRLRAITPAVVREWHADITRAARERATAPPRRLSDAQAARAWARGHGLEVAAVGRLSPELLDRWRRAGRPQPTKPAPRHTPGKAQAAHAYSLLRSVLETAVRDDLLDANPCHIPGAGTVKPNERVPATTAEVELLASAMPARYRAAVTVAAWSGLRAGELFALTRADVDLDAGTLRVRRALVELTGQPIGYGPPKSDAGRRVVHLPRTVVDTLAAHMLEHTPAQPDALVFGTATGGPLPRSHRSKLFAKARATVNRPDLRWHDLRHTGAVLAASTGASLAELQRRLGHSTARAAMIYQHASDERDALVAQRLDALASPTGNVVPLAPRQAPARQGSADA